MSNVEYLKKNYYHTSLLTTFLLGILVLLSSCNSSEKEMHTYFGGKIKNPKDNYVYFSQGKKKIDSAKLDSNNKFSFQLDSIKQGLYTFNHGAEFQYLYLEPQDSLLIYLNTWDFDESLIFSGKGSAKNNFLINLYLRQEKNEKSFKPHFKLKEKEFEAKIDKGIKEQLEYYNDFLSNQSEPPSEFFDKLVKTGIYFPFYFLKEYYPINHKWYAKMDHYPELDKGFYAYREDLNLNDESLMNYATYTIYIRTYLYNRAYQIKDMDPEQSNVELNFMKMVDKKIQIEALRNQFFATSAWRTLSKESIPDKDRKEVKEYFFAHCTNEVYKNEIRISSEQKSKLKKGDQLPNLQVTNSKGEMVLVNNVARDNKTVIYFWPKELALVEMVSEKLHKMEKQYPDVLFIGIERNKTDHDWYHFIEDRKLPKDQQFKLAKDSECYALFAGDMARTIIVDQNGQIEKPFLFFNDKYFDKHLKHLK